jgi:transmembrane sensor
LKNGYFYINGSPIKPIMRKLSTYYHIDVSYRGETPSSAFYGQFPASKNIRSILHILEQTKSVRFEMDGNRVTVLNGR